MSDVEVSKKAIAKTFGARQEKRMRRLKRLWTPLKW